MNCALTKCGIYRDFTAQGMDLGGWQYGTSQWFAEKGWARLSRVVCSAEKRDCVTNYLAGHAQNILRFGGEEVLRIYGSVGFAVVEPQETDGSRAVKCAWRQTTLNPVLPEDCKKAVAKGHYPEQVACGLSFTFQVYDPAKFPEGPRVSGPTGAISEK